MLYAPNLASFVYLEPHEIYVGFQYEYPSDAVRIDASCF